jgi:hypothetical protein
MEKNTAHQSQNNVEEFCEYPVNSGQLLASKVRKKFSILGKLDSRNQNIIRS